MSESVPILSTSLWGVFFVWARYNVAEKLALALKLATTVIPAYYMLILMVGSPPLGHSARPPSSATQLGHSAQPLSLATQLCYHQTFFSTIARFSLIIRTIYDMFGLLVHFSDTLHLHPSLPISLSIRTNYLTQIIPAHYLPQIIPTHYLLQIISTHYPLQIISFH